ncbi:unnamed protein product, partial [Coregonus sp. 'balchen']
PPTNLPPSQPPFLPIPHLPSSPFNLTPWGASQRKPYTGKLEQKESRTQMAATGCNVQDYIWHKGSRCESVVTEFQVLCLTIGASALMVLLLFMIIVCFTKKLHVLKTENSKLRKRSSKYRPPSEQHNDNFSLSTIAEGSHPNDDPNAPNKLEDPVKAPVPKEDDSLNIHNSLTPKHENHKVLGEENSSEVPKALPKAPVVNRIGARPRGKVLRWEDDMYPPSHPCPVYSPLSTRSLPTIDPRGYRARPQTAKVCTP